MLRFLSCVPFCMLFADLGSTIKSAIFFLFSFYLTLVLFLPPCPFLHLSFYLKLCGRSGRNCLLSPFVLLGYNGSADTRFSRGTTRLMSWLHGVRYLCHPQSLVVSLLLFLVSTLLFSRTGGVLSHRSSLTDRFPQFPLRNMCSLVMLAVFSLCLESSEKNKPCLTKMMTPPLAFATSVEKIPDREWVPWDCRAENPGIRKGEDKLRLDSWI